MTGGAWSASLQAGRPRSSFRLAVCLCIRTYVRIARSARAACRLRPCVRTRQCSWRTAPHLAVGHGTRQVRTVRLTREVVQLVESICQNSRKLRARFATQWHRLYSHRRQLRCKWGARVIPHPGWYPGNHVGRLAPCADGPKLRPPHARSVAESACTAPIFPHFARPPGRRAPESVSVAASCLREIAQTRRRDVETLRWAGSPMASWTCQRAPSMLMRAS